LFVAFVAFCYPSKMNRKMIIFTVIAVPVALVLIAGIVVIYLCIETCTSNRLCVPLDKSSDPVNSKVYEGGTHLISPTQHFSPGLPAKGHPMNVHVFTEGDVFDDVNPNNFPVLDVYVVFRFYVEKDNVYDYFYSLQNNFTSTDIEIADVVNSNISRVLYEIVSTRNCSAYNAGYSKENSQEHEDKWKEIFAKECKERFEEEGMLFSLDEETPIYSVSFFNGCLFPFY